MPVRSTQYNTMDKPSPSELAAFLIQEFPQTKCTVEAVGDMGARFATRWGLLNCGPAARYRARC